MELIVDSVRSLPLTALFHHPLLQQECEELARRVTDLESENSALRVEIESLKKLRGELKAENKSIMVSCFITCIIYLGMAVILHVDME